MGPVAALSPASTHRPPSQRTSQRMRRLFLVRRLNCWASPGQRLSGILESKFSDTGKLLENQARPCFSGRRPSWPRRLGDLTEPEPGEQAPHCHRVPDGGGAPLGGGGAHGRAGGRLVAKQVQRCESDFCSDVAGTLQERLVAVSESKRERKGPLEDGRGAEGEVGGDS